MARLRRRHLRRHRPFYIVIRKCESCGTDTRVAGFTSRIEARKYLDSKQSSATFTYRMESDAYGGF